MWRGKSRTQSESGSHRRSHSFVHATSFKDVQELCRDDDCGGAAETSRPKRASSVFHRVLAATAALRSFRPNPLPSPDPPPGEERRIVVYFTSLRVIRQTFDDCLAVQSILKGFRLLIDERDVSMHNGFLDELREILGRKIRPTLPRVFIGGRHLGGADEIRQLHESGELKKIVEGFPRANTGACAGCGGLRFVLCSSCSGSRKCYSEKAGFRTCLVCNENGLIRCRECV